MAFPRDRGIPGGCGTQRGVSDRVRLSHPWVQGLVEVARCIAGRATHAVVEMGSPPTGLPAVVKRRREPWVTGVRARTDSRSWETIGPNATGSRQTDQGPVTQRPQNAREKKYPKGLDHSGNIEGNLKAFLPRPRRQPRRAPARAAPPARCGPPRRSGPQPGVARSGPAARHG